MNFLVREIRQEIEIEGIQIGRKVVKASIFTDHVISYAEHSKKTNTRLNTKQLGNELGKSTVYTINRKKVSFFPVTINKPRKENLKMILFTIASVRINYLGINSTSKM